MTSYTTDEVREKFLLYARLVVEEWARSDRSPYDIARGAIFSLLAALDGEAADLPAFNVLPAPHDDDAGYHASRGERYYPSGIAHDIAGGLHERFASLMLERQPAALATEEQ